MAELAVEPTAPRSRLQLAHFWATTGGISRLSILLAAGLAIRLSLTPFGSFRGDLQGFRVWATRLATQPLPSFYEASRLVDHLPGDMWLLWVLAKGYQILSPDMQVQAFTFVLLLKAVAALADVGIGIMLFLLGRHLGGPSLGLLAAALFMLNPASVFLTSIWVSWDPIPVFFVLAAVWLLWRGNPEWSLPVLTYAALVKPQYAALAPLLAIAYAHRYVVPHTRWAGRLGAAQPTEPLIRSLQRAAIAVAASVLLLLTLTVPFNVGVPPLPTRWTLFERLGYAFDAWKESWLGAFNLWALWAMRSPRVRESDGVVSLFGLTYQNWGALLAAAAYLAILVTFWLRRGDLAFLYACLAVTFSLFMLPTRVQPRYLFPSVVLAALVAALAPHRRWFYVALTATYLANLCWSYNLHYPVLDLGFLYDTDLFVRVVALANLGLLLYAILGRVSPPDRTQRPEHHARWDEESGHS